jgi:hypothetical protein
MKKMKTSTAARRLYTEPQQKIKPLDLQKGLCVSGGLPPIEEEDAGIDQWGE